MKSDLCPVAAMVSYLQHRRTDTGPLFRFEDGRLLTRARLVEFLRSGLKEAGVDDSKYCSHSFRIGAATTAAKVGIEDSVIKTLGRWESLAYLQYVKIPRAKLAGYTERLAIGAVDTRSSRSPLSELEGPLLVYSCVTLSPGSKILLLNG